jgi:hypothetical protein
MFILFNLPPFRTADVTVKKLIEGNSTINCRSLNAKMINGDNVVVAADNVQIEAMYGARAGINAVNDITIGLSRGDLDVRNARVFVSLNYFLTFPELITIIAGAKFKRKCFRQRYRWIIRH